MELKRLPKRPSKMKRLFSKIIKKIKGIDDSIKLYFAILLVCFIIVARWFVVAPIEEGFGNNIRVEFFGFMFDLAIFGVGFSIFNQWNQHRQDIKRWREEIDDFRGWKGKEYRRRIIENIKRLNQAGVTNIDLRWCFLNGVNLKNRNLNRADFRCALLKNASLSGAHLVGAKFSGANLEEADFYEAHLEGANFSGAIVKGIILDNAFLEGAIVGGRNSINWLEDLEKLQVGGYEELLEKYQVVLEGRYCIIRQKI